MNKGNTYGKSLRKYSQLTRIKNKATLGLLAVVTAKKKGHKVKVFFAADGVHLMNCKEKGEIVGKGTGDAKHYLDHLKVILKYSY